VQVTFTNPLHAISKTSDPELVFFTKKSALYGPELAGRCAVICPSGVTDTPTCAVVVRVNAKRNVSDSPSIRTANVVRMSGPS
jgi:hypothetical protein